MAYCSMSQADKFVQKASKMSKWMVGDYSDVMLKNVRLRRLLRRHSRVFVSFRFFSANNKWQLQFVIKE